VIPATHGAVAVFVLLAAASGCRSSSVSEHRSAPSASITLADPLVPPPKRAPALSPDLSETQVESASFRILAYTATREAHVIVDGRPVGRTPGRINVPLGQHTVVFVAAAPNQRRVLAVDVRADGDLVVPVHGDFENDRGP
jgi:hypothetical protein